MKQDYSPAFLLMTFCMMSSFLLQANEVDDIYTLSEQELQKIGLHKIIEANSELQLRYDREVKELNKLKVYNGLLCKELTRLKSTCPGFMYLTNSFRSTELSCNGDKAIIKPTAMKVYLSESEGQSFRIQANHDYISNVFSRSGSVVIFEKTIGNSGVKSIRFKDIHSLNIVAVNRNSEIKSGIITQRELRPKNLKIKIKVGHTDGESDFRDEPVPLMTGDERGWLTLVKPDSLNDDGSSYRISPIGIHQIGQQEGCYLTQADLDGILTKATKEAENFRN